MPKIPFINRKTKEQKEVEEAEKNEQQLREAETEARLIQSDSQMLQGEIFNSDADVLGAVITPMNSKVLSQYISLRDINLSNLQRYDVPAIIFFVNQIIFLDYHGWIASAAQYGDLLETYLMAHGAIESRTFNGVTTKKAEIKRIGTKMP